jgi:hypothetical protein
MKITREIIDEFLAECNGSAKMHLARLKSLAKLLVTVHQIPGFDLEGTLNLSPKESRPKLIGMLCSNRALIEGMIRPTTAPQIVQRVLPPPVSAQAPLPRPLSQIPPMRTPAYGAPMPRPSIVHPRPAPIPPRQALVPLIQSHVKPKSAEKIVAESVALRTRVVDPTYLTTLKKTISRMDNDAFTLESLERDIKNDAFVRRAIAAHVQALEFKLKRYRKLSQLDWQAGGKRFPNRKIGGVGNNQENLNEIITQMIALIQTRLRALQTDVKAFEHKRNALMSILYDPDNGVATIRGSSREGVRMAIVKMIYMFFKVPDFFFKGFVNFMVTGPAGSGKTKIASVLGHVLKNLGILATEKVVMATKQNLVAGFMGQSGPKTRNLLAKSLEGVVFIDEAYTLTPCPGQQAKNDNFSEEAVGELINFMDKFVGCMVIIVAGYKDKMYECFLAFNEGMARRFPKVIDLLPYDTDDLYNIFETFLADSIDIHATLPKDKRMYIKGVMDALNKSEVFNNQAGDMLNLSKVIGEDAVLMMPNYTKQMINLSFQKFCAGKNIAIDF